MYIEHCVQPMWNNVCHTDQTNVLISPGHYYVQVICHGSLVVECILTEPLRFILQDSAGVHALHVHSIKLNVYLNCINVLAHVLACQSWSSSSYIRALPQWWVLSHNLHWYQTAYKPHTVNWRESSPSCVSIPAYTLCSSTLFFSITQQ